MRSLTLGMTQRFVLAGAVVVLLPVGADAYVNSGFRTRAEYERHLKEEERLRNPRTARDFCDRAARNWWDAPQAKYDYTRAILLDRSCGEAWLGRGEVLWRQGRYIEAVDDF